MLTRRIIPCLDVRDGRTVKGVRFANLRDAGDPAELACAYEAQGADELVMLDVSATPEGRATAIDTVRVIRRAIAIPLTVGGGVRSVRDAEALLSVGADRVALNTAAVERPEIIAELADRVGRQCVVVSIDAAQRERADGWEVVTRSGANRTGADAVAWSIEAANRGVGEILLTSWDRDGSRSGYDLALIKTISDAAPIPLIASGGADSAQHMADAFHAGADAALAASIFHDRNTTVGEIKRSLADRGIEVRP